MINFENENFSDLILNNNLFKDKNEYIKNIQNPVTRLKDTNELIAGAKLAIQQFSDLDVKASAICVVLYRIIEDCDIAITVDDFLQEGYLLREKLDNIDKFESIRWYLSLGLVMAAVELKENRIDKSICLLSQNTQRLYVSSRHGQPFTNVVKSFSALIGIYKYIGFRNEWSEIQLINFLDLYASINIEAFINYKFENQWVYEELSLVFSILYEIAKFNALRISNSEKKISELFESFDYLKIPEPFRSLLKKITDRRLKKSAVYDAPHMVLSNEYGHLFLTGDGNKCHEQHLGIVRIDAFVAKKWIDQIIEMENIAKGTNSLFCFLTAPDKQSIYWETLCDKEDNRNIKKIFDGLNSTIYHDPLQEIIDSNLAKEFDVYPKVDSHWCSIGAIVALQGILKKMGENFDLLSVINSCEDNSIGGDLGIKTTPRTLGVARDLKSSLWKSLLIYDNSVPDNGRIRLFENSNALVKEKILFVGDSFSYKLADIASQIFQSVFHFHGQFIDKECLRIIHPKYFIFEQTERFFIKEPKYSLDESFFQILEDKVKSNVEVKNFLNNCRVTPKNDISLNVDQLLIIDLSESYLQKLDLLEQKYSSKKLELFLQTVKKIY